MEKFKQLQTVKKLYAQGQNIIEYLKSAGNQKKNSIEDILISYDFQAGSYVKGYSENTEYKNKYCSALAEIIDGFGEVQSLMEIGVGEATTLSTLHRALKKKPADVLGFDISWSRLKFAKEFLKDLNIADVQLFTANLFEIPLKDNSVDVVYTSHSIEPNGGREEEALKELYRVAGKFLVLLEPAYELASEEARQRMVQHGYITNMLDTAKDLGYKIIEHRLFDHSANPLNPTGLMIIEKTPVANGNAKLVCPLTHSELQSHNDSFLFANDCGLAYPVLDGIPCLLKENSILATHLTTDYKQFKIQNRIEIQR